MSVNTPNYGFTAPSSTDAPDGATQMQTLATQLDTAMGGAFTSKQSTYITSSGSFASTVYPNAKALLIECWGSGGASGASLITTTGQSSGGGGGKSGDYSVAVKLVSALTFPLAIVIGAGGTGGAGAGGNGALTSVKNSSTTYCAAAGGNGGAALAASATLNVSTGGTTSTGTSVGDLVLPGSDGGQVLRYTATGVMAGDGGAAPHGGGERRAVGGFGSAAVAGQFPGGGAAGGNNVASAAAQNGASGAAGQVRISAIY